MTEIIVYRNPIEKMIWDILLTGEYFPVFAGCIVFIVMFLISHTICCKFIKGYNYSYKYKWLIWVLFAISLLFAIITVYYLFI